MYKVESMTSWFIVDVSTKGKAYSEGVREWGNGAVTAVTKASKDDIKYFKNLKGEDAVRSN